MSTRDSRQSPRAVPLPCLPSLSIFGVGYPFHLMAVRVLSSNLPRPLSPPPTPPDRTKHLRDSPRAGSRGREQGAHHSLRKAPPCFPVVLNVILLVDAGLPGLEPHLLVVFSFSSLVSRVAGFPWWWWRRRPGCCRGDDRARKHNRQKGEQMGKEEEEEEEPKPRRERRQSRTPSHRGSSSDGQEGDGEGRNDGGCGACGERCSRVEEGSEERGTSAQGGTSRAVQAAHGEVVEAGQPRQVCQRYAGEATVCFGFVCVLRDGRKREKRKGGWLSPYQYDAEIRRWQYAVRRPMHFPRGMPQL